MGEVEFSALSADSEDHGAGAYGRVVRERREEAVADVLDRGHRGVDDRQVVLLDLLTEPEHQIEAIDLRIARVVLDSATDGGLATEPVAHDQAVELVAGRVQRRGKRSSPLSGDKDIRRAGFWHYFFSGPRGPLRWG